VRDDRWKYKRGETLPQSRLTNDDVRLIHEAVEERQRLREQANQLSNQALAQKLGVHQRTVDKVVQRRSWMHVT